MKIHKRLTTGHFIDFEDEFNAIEDKNGVYNDAARVVTAAIKAGMFSDVESGVDIEQFIRETDPLELRETAKAVNSEYLSKYAPKPPDPNS